jgi:photosystem II stability/assembly factor-like uncharacterized protein
MTSSAGLPEIEQIVYGVAAAPAAGGAEVCFAAHTRGISRSSDGGQTWQAAFESRDPQVPVAVTSLAISPGFERDGCVLAAAPGAIIATRDGGQSWSSASLPLPSPIVSAMALSPGFERDGMAFAATLEDGVFLSSDYGRSWVAWNLGLLDHAVLALAVSPSFPDDRTLFAGTESGIFHSTNGGRFWCDTVFPTEGAPVLCLALSPHFAHDGQILAGTAEHGLLTARRPWESWQPLGQDQLGGGAINSLLLGPEFPSRPDMLILHDDRLLISRDGGRSWEPCGASAAQGLSAVAAPWGLDRGAALLGGYVGGLLRRVPIDAG